MVCFDHPSPTVVLPPANPFNNTQTRPSFTSPFTTGASGFTDSANFTPNFTPSTSAPPSAAGRKRSRDEAATNLDEDYFPIQIPQKEPENESEWTYGEGMTLIKKDKGYVAEAGSQTGTWQEEKEKAEEEAIKAALAAQQDRPVLRATKSLRLDMTATPPIQEEVGLHSAVSIPSPERSAYVEPAVDDFTRHLGIGWSAISSDVDIQAAARGWTKFIENHFPVTNAEIKLQSRGLSSYLVQANEGFFLFQEDLKRGQLVSTTLEKTMQNLSSPTPLFDGTTVLEASDLPKSSNDILQGDASMPTPSTNTFATNGGMPTSAPTIAAGNGVTKGTTHGNSSAPHQTLEVEMDMS